MKCSCIRNNEDASHLQLTRLEQRKKRLARYDLITNGRNSFNVNEQSISSNGLG